jgi:hypothetical protein
VQVPTAQWSKAGLVAVGVEGAAVAAVRGFLEDEERAQAAPGNQQEKRELK